MRVTYNHLTATIVAVATSLPLACGDSTGSVSPETAGGSIAVSISTAGATPDRDPDGYNVTVDGGVSRPVAINGSLTIDSLSAGTHTVRLDGLAANCTVAGANPQTVVVAAGDNPVRISFAVGCTARLGMVRVTTATTGVELDPDGYTLFLQLPARPFQGALAVNGTRDFPDIPAGTFAVALLGVAGNCTVSGPKPRTVTITPGATTEVGFVIQCALSGTLAVTTTTTGNDPDQNGYSLNLSVAGVNSLPSNAQLLPNGNSLVPRLLPGTYTVTIHDISANCDATGPNPRSIIVGTGDPTPLTVEVRCEWARDFAYVIGNGPLTGIALGVSNGSSSGTQITSSTAGDLEPAWSPDGSRIAFSSLRDGNQEIYAINADRTATVRLTNNSAKDSYPAWSPDGKRIAFVSDRDGNSEIYVMNTDGTNPVRLTSEIAPDLDPAWSPDGTRIAFRSDRGGMSGIWVMRADGIGPTRLTSHARVDAQPAWSPDGTRIVFTRGAIDTLRDIVYMNADGSGITAVAEGVDGASGLAWSPDGRKIAFTRVWDYYGTFIEIQSLTGVPYTYPKTSLPASDPAWRP